MALWHVLRGDLLQVVYKKAGLKGLKMDLSNAESTTDLSYRAKSKNNFKILAGR
jgi:hypothetical protein